MRFLFIVAAVCFAYTAQAQTRDFESKFEWVKKTFEENDAGFQYIIDKKGRAAYDIHNRLTMEKIKAATTSDECYKLLYEWLKFFRSGHIGIEQLTNGASVSPNAGVYETWNGDISRFEKYIDGKKEADYEGIWEIGAGAYKIGIQKEGSDYIGFIIESDVDGWREPGQVKLKFEQVGDKLKSTFFMRNHSPVESGEPELTGNNYLQFGQHILKRLKPIFPDDRFIENYFRSVSSQNPYMEELNAATLYFRIPSFDLHYKPAIDKVIADNKDKILRTENLIIDLRNNGGGGDSSFEELLPFLYTNPVRTIYLEFLSTPLNNQEFLDSFTGPHLNEETQQFAKNTYDKLQEKLGEFVFPFDEPVSIYRQDTVYEYPKKVGVIIHEQNGSTTEQFLLAAKQSKKVKLFGVTTMGALDISNMASAESPCKEFRLWYCISKSLRIPDMPIDDIGLQPDFYLDKSIPQYKWVEFVNDILNQ